MNNLTKTVKDYEEVLRLRQQLDEKYQAKLKMIKEQQDALEKYLLEQTEVIEVDTPQDIQDLSPFVFWHIQPKTDDKAVAAYRKLRDNSVRTRKTGDVEADAIDDQKDIVGAWILSQLNARGNNSINCGEAGKAYRKLVTKASAADFDAFIKWCAENNAADAVQKRVSNTFVSKYFDDHEEFPPFLNVEKAYEVVVTK